MVRTFNERDKRISDALMAAWRDAEDAGEEAEVERIKAALDALDLPWVPITEGTYAS